MQAEEFDSKEFQQAELKSERIRIISIMAALAAMAVFILLRTLLFQVAREKWSLIFALAILAIMIGYEAVMLGRVLEALRAERDLSRRTWVVNLFIETLFPTIAMVVFIFIDVSGPYLVLLSPVVLTYFLFISLSTLRLNPTLCRLGGLFSAGGYMAVTGFVFLFYPRPEVGQGMVPYDTYPTNAFIILVAGLAAGEVARQIRQHVTTALREARESERLKSDLEIARSIQQGLLPNESPELQDFEIAGWNKPADQTGGDYYGWQQLPDGRTTFTLADVTGHGIGAALMASATHAYTRASMTGDSDLGTILSRINELLAKDLPSGRLVTFVSGVLEPKEGRVKLLSAGHGPILHYTAANDQVHSFGAHGVPFGVLPDMSYGPAQDIVLAPGDMLILITDGFFEWANPQDEEFGTERLAEAVRAAKGMNASDVITSLYHKVLSFVAGTVQNDDLTAIVLKRR